MRRNPFFFIYNNTKLWLENHPITPNTDTASNIIHTLRKDGICILPNHYNIDLIKDLCSNVPSLDKFCISPEGDCSYYYPRASSLNETQFFFNDPLIEEVAKGYLGGAAIPLRETIGIKTKKKHVSFENFPHRDSWLPRLKVFLYLTDVKPGNGPFCYIKGTHKPTLKSLYSRYLIYRDYLSNEEGYAKNEDIHYVGCYWPHDIKKMVDRGKFKITKAYCDSGSLIFFDARGIHYGEILGCGERHILNSYWILNNHHT
ncbi:MAG: phytanoyl-CoA dioxygenase family protein [Sedimenticola sp.]